MADIYNDTDGRIVTGTAFADTIHNNGGNNVSISAGAGNDSVLVEGGHNVTVSGGKSNDYVQHEWGAGAVYVYSGGNDTLKGLLPQQHCVGHRRQVVFDTERRLDGAD